MKWSIPSFNIFPPRATPWAFENWFIQIPVPWTKLCQNPPPKCWIWWSIILQKARTATVTFYSFTSNRFDYSSFKTQTLEKFTSEPSARQRELFFFKHLHVKVEYSSGKTWHFRFKFPILPRHGSNSPPPAHGWKSNARELSKRGEGCWAFELIDT